MSESNFAGCMVGSAIGDALGESFAQSWLLALEINKIPFRGRWTDDTHMMIGLAESLIQREGLEGEHMVWNFVRNWEKEPWRGYGPGPPRVFRMIKSGVPWHEAAKRLYNRMGSFGNGAAMRVAPIGLLYSDETAKLREAAYRSAELTHTHELGKEGAALQAYAVALAMETGKSRFEPSRFLRKIEEFADNEVYRKKMETARGLLDVEDAGEVLRGLGNTVEAFNSVPTAIYCFARNHEDYADALLYAVSLGGDSDTIGAMTGAIAGAHHGEESLPRIWQEKLEKADYIRRLASNLYSLRMILH